jgi:uncharacterized protein
MRIVSNTSPLINLAWVGKLDLIPQLYGSIMIPEAVWNEIVIKGEGQPGAEEVKSSSWITVKPVCNLELVQSFRQELDAGEAEAIALALENEADLLLMDERLGRETATYFGLRVLGVIGILVEAKSKGKTTQIKPALDHLQSMAGFYISASLYERILREQNESS